MLGFFLVFFFRFSYSPILCYSSEVLRVVFQTKQEGRVGGNGLKTSAHGVFLFGNDKKVYFVR